MKHRHIVTVILTLGLCVGCASVSQEKVLEMTKQLVQAQVSTHMQQEQWIWETDWAASEDIPLEDAMNRIPSWAEAKYTMCVHWDTPFTYREWNHARQRGEPEYYDHEERAWAWVMYDRKLRVHILEVGYTYEGRNYTAVDGWEEPAEAEDS